MRRTMLFCETLRENPADTDIASHQLLIRGSYIQGLAAGIYSFLPLGERVKSKIEAIIREEMNAVTGQEISMPVVHPAELWQETGRWYAIGDELARFKDRSDRDMVLAMTHEEVVADLLRKQVKSYRQLPVVLYQFQTKFRDEPRARGGLIRVREFVMKDAYSCHTTFEDLDRYYSSMYQAYFNCFRRAGLDVVAVQSDVGMMGGTMAHEFMYVSNIGEDHLLICDHCGYAANRQVALFRKDVANGGEAAALEEVKTPGTQTISDLAKLLDVPESQTAKAAFFMNGDQLIFAVIRGDMEVNETKLSNALGGSELRPARADELEAAGIVVGYASPIGVEGVTVVVDDLVANSPNLIAGANRRDYHLRNTNYGRDYKADIVTDIAAAYEGAPCPQCGGPLRMVRGIEVGNLFKLGTTYSEGLNATYLDEHGDSHYIVMGSYGIGLGRLMACVAEACRDESGLIWPVTVAPYQVYLVGLDLDRDEIKGEAETLYRELLDAGVEVLYDDRAERAGVKFNDADLLGMPLRLTISRRTVAGSSIEVKRRGNGDALQIPRDEIVAWVQAEIERMTQDIQATVKAEALPAEV